MCRKTGSVGCVGAGGLERQGRRSAPARRRTPRPRVAGAEEVDINELRTVTRDVVETARETLVIG